MFKPYFIKSCSSTSNWIKDDVKEICFLGRSNVGKSSLINALANQKIAITSNVPGRTKLVNFYNFDKFRLIDLPGYGYAKVNKNKKQEMDNLIMEYLVNRVNLYSVFQVCDANVLTNDDCEVSKFLQTKFVNHYIILNKIDRQNKSFYENNKHKIANFLKVNVENIIPVSAKKMVNINSLYKKIIEVIKEV